MAVKRACALRATLGPLNMGPYNENTYSKACLVYVRYGVTLCQVGASIIQYLQRTPARALCSGTDYTFLVSLYSKITYFVILCVTRRS
jgi:hypothetical protein